MGVRVEVDARSETVNLKIRQAQLNKIPCMLVVGDREITADVVSVRLSSGRKLTSQSFGDFKTGLRIAIANRVKEWEL
jgi:threonyl-tRNA synthetase